MNIDYLQILAMIEVLSLYNTIPSEEKRMFERAVKSDERKKGDYLLFDGDIQSNLYLIRSGVAYLYDDSGSNLKVLDFFYNNRFCLDFNSFTNQIPSSYCIECLSDCFIETINYESFLQAFEKSAATERAYRMLLERILVAALVQKSNQTALTIEDRFKLLMHHKPELFKLVPHKYIASYANIDATNFSKLYNKHCVNSGLLYE